MQFFSMRCNLEFRKLTFYGLTRPQSIRKSKQISGQVILSSPQDLEFNPNFAKNLDIPVVKNSVPRPARRASGVNDGSISIQRWSHAKFQHTIYITSFNTLILFRRFILFGYNI